LSGDIRKRPDNKEMGRGEEPTKSITPDKMDRSMKQKGDSWPYPLTEEEATPKVSKSQKQ
jgi:hypothetical protein